MTINEILQWIILIWIVWSLKNIMYDINIILDGIKAICELEEEKRKKNEHRN